MISVRYPGATIRPSVIKHPDRPETRGICIHWTAGSYYGDISVLDGPSVDCFAYVAKSGEVVQFLDPDSVSWTAKTTANHTCVHIETEGRGEAWTEPQLESVAKLTAWLCDRYAIPCRKVDPPMDWRGIFGHRDLSLGGPRVDGNDHTDTVPDGTGWPRFLAAVERHLMFDEELESDLRYFLEDAPWPTGEGPRELGPWSSELVRDAVYLVGKAAGRVYSKQAINGAPGILWWKPGTYDGLYVFGPWRDQEAQKRAREVWQERLSRARGREVTLRPYQGRNRSMYRHRRKPA